jgi:hypothetical protein
VQVQREQTKTKEGGDEGNGGLTRAVLEESKISGDVDQGNVAKGIGVGLVTSRAWSKRKIGRVSSKKAQRKPFSTWKWRRETDELLNSRSNSYRSITVS